MKCFILVRKKGQAQTPIMDCAAIMLTGKEQLIVSEDVGALVLKKYPDYVTKIGVCEKDSLRHGRFELEPFKAAGEPATSKEKPTEPPLKSRSSDRSMGGKGRKKAKKKGK